MDESRVGNEPSDHEHYCERAEHYERMSEQRPSPAHERRAKALLRSPSAEQRIGLLGSLVITIAYVVRDENMGSRIDCVIIYDGLSSLFKTAVRSLTCDLTCSFPYSLPSRLSTSLSCSLSSSLPASLSSSLLCGFPANLLFSLLGRHRHMCISHSTPGEALSRVHIPQPFGRGTVTCAYPTTAGTWRNSECPEYFNLD